MPEMLQFGDGRHVFAKVYWYLHECMTCRHSSIPHRILGGVSGAIDTWFFIAEASQNIKLDSLYLACVNKLLKMTRKYLNLRRMGANVGHLKWTFYSCGHFYTRRIMFEHQWKIPNLKFWLIKKNCIIWEIVVNNLKVLLRTACNNNKQCRANQFNSLMSVIIAPKEI